MEEQSESSVPQSPAFGPIRAPRLQSIPSGGLESVTSGQPCHDSGGNQDPNEGTSQFITIEDPQRGRRLIIPWPAAQDHLAVTQTIKWESLQRDVPVDPECYDLVSLDGGVISTHFWEDLVKPGMLLQLKWTCDCPDHPGPKNKFNDEHRDDFRGRRRRRYVSPLSDYSDGPRRRSRARSRSVDSLHDLIEKRHAIYDRYDDRYDDHSLPPAMSPDFTQDLDQLRRRVSDGDRTASPTSCFHIAYASIPRFDRPWQIVAGPKQQVEAAFPFLNMKWVHMRRESMDFAEFQVAAINEFGEDPKSSYAILSLLRQVQIEGLWSYDSHSPEKNFGCALDGRENPETRFIAFPYLRVADPSHASPAQGGPRALLDAFNRPWPTESPEKPLVVHQVWILLHGAGILTCGSMGHEDLLGDEAAVVPMKKPEVPGERMIYLSCLPNFFPDFRAVPVKECRSYLKLNALAQDMIGPEMGKGCKLLFPNGSEVTATSWVEVLQEESSAPIVILLKESWPDGSRRHFRLRSTSSSPVRETTTRLVRWSNRPARALSLSPSRGRRRRITARVRQLNRFDAFVKSISLDEEDTASEKGEKSDTHHSPAAGTELDSKLVPFLQWATHSPRVDDSFDHTIQPALDNVLSSISSDSRIISTVEPLLERGNQCIGAYAPLPMCKKTLDVKIANHHLPAQTVADKQGPWAVPTPSLIREIPSGDGIARGRLRAGRMAELALELLAHFVTTSSSHPLLLKYYGAVDSWEHLAKETMSRFSAIRTSEKYEELLDFSIQSVALLCKNTRDIALGAFTELGPDEGCSSWNAEIQQAFVDAFRKIVLFVFACRTALHEIHSISSGDDPGRIVQQISQHQHILRVLARDARAQVSDAKERVSQALERAVRELDIQESTGGVFGGQPMSALDLVKEFIHRLARKPICSGKDDIGTIVQYHRKLKLTVSSNPSRRHLHAITAHRNTIQALRLLAHFQSGTGQFLMSGYVPDNRGDVSGGNLCKNWGKVFHAATRNREVVYLRPGGSPKQVALKRLLNETKAMRTEILDFAQFREPPVDIPPSTRVRLLRLKVRFGTPIRLLFVAWAAVITLLSLTLDRILNTSANYITERVSLWSDRLLLQALAMGVKSVFFFAVILVTANLIFHHAG